MPSPSIHTPALALKKKRLTRLRWFLYRQLKLTLTADLLLLLFAMLVVMVVLVMASALLLLRHFTGYGVKLLLVLLHSGVQAQSYKKKILLVNYATDQERH